MRCAGCLAAALLASAGPALAAGGPHLVDDAGTVEAGHCELEAYGSAVNDGEWRAVTSPTCGFKWLGGFEVGLILAAEPNGGSSVHLIPGIAAKKTIGHVGPIAVAAEASLGFDPEGNQLDYSSNNLAWTWLPRKWLELHVNTGLDLEPGAKPIPTWGGAMLVEPIKNFQLVLEEAGRSGFKSRFQTGMRLKTTHLVYDLLYSRNLDESRGVGWVTLGVTWAFAR